MAASKWTAPRRLKISLHGKRFEVLVAHVRENCPYVIRLTRDVVDRATSHYWFWALDRDIADAIAQTLLDQGDADGARDGHQLVELLRKLSS